MHLRRLDGSLQSCNLRTDWQNSVPSLEKLYASGAKCHGSNYAKSQQQRPVWNLNQSSPVDSCGIDILATDMSLLPGPYFLKTANWANSRIDQKSRHDAFALQHSALDETRVSANQWVRRAKTLNWSCGWIFAKVPQKQRAHRCSNVCWNSWPGDTCFFACYFNFEDLGDWGRNRKDERGHHEGSPVDIMGPLEMIW